MSNNKIDPFTGCNISGEEEEEEKDNRSPLIRLLFRK